MYALRDAFQSLSDKLDECVMTIAGKSPEYIWAYKEHTHKLRELKYQENDIASAKENAEKAHQKSLGITIEKSSKEPKLGNSKAWRVLARARALEIIKADKAIDSFPSQVMISDLIAAEFRVSGIYGIDGKPISGEYIKRHALKGISSAIGKRLSTVKP